jgi:CBS domain-containing protein
MHEQQVGSIVVVDAQKAPLGIFTLRDLRQVVANGTNDFNETIERHMTHAPFFLSPDHSAFDAAIAMTERHIAHVCLVKNQRLCGVVSERDLFSLQRVDLVHLARTIRSAQRVETWSPCAARSANWWSACWPTARLRPRSPTSSPCSTTTPCAG